MVDPMNPEPGLDPDATRRDTGMPEESDMRRQKRNR
jgi:hypothetical protein